MSEVTRASGEVARSRRATMAVHARAAVGVAVFTAVTYATGWGFSLPYVHVLLIADAIDDGGEQSGRVTLAWAVAATVVAQVGVALGLVPVMAIDVRSSHLVAGVSVTLVVLVTQRLRSSAATRQAAEDRLARRERRFRRLVEDATEVLILLDEDLRIAYASPSLARVRAGDERDVEGEPYARLVHAEDAARVLAAVTAVRDGDDDSTLVTFRLRDGRGGEVEVEASHRDLLDDPDVGALVVSLRDVAERQRLQAEIEHGRSHDALTDLPNRVTFVDHVDAALFAYGPSSVGVLGVGLDGTEQIAEAAGRDTLDALVVEVASDLAAALGEDDVLARVGETQFGVLACDLDGTADLHTLAERLRTVVQRVVDVDHAEASLCSSVGFVVASADTTGGRGLLHAAEVALASARSAPDGIALFDETMRAELLARLAAERELAEAIADDQLVLHYQPLVGLGAADHVGLGAADHVGLGAADHVGLGAADHVGLGAADDGLGAEDGFGPPVVGVEALVRWEHPTRGLLPPSEFVPLAEETGLVVDLGWYVLDAALAQLANWDILLGTGAIGYVSVNVSMLQVATGELAARVERALATYGIAPHRLLLELTETALVEDPEGMAPQLTLLTGLGVDIAVDDFGTGYSSLAQLQRFTVDVLKIDRTFVSMDPDGSHRPELLRSLRQLGDALGLRTVAEGIETEAELAAVRELRFDVGQGYLFGRPAPAEDITDTMRARLGLGSRDAWQDPERAGTSA